MSASQGRLTWAQRLSYGLSEYGKGFFMNAPNLVWLFFLTDVLEIPPATAGIIILIPMAWDAITDPAMGYIADRTRTPFGKYRPYLLFATPVCAIAFVLLFSKPDLSGGAMVAYALITALLFRTSFTIVDVPHNGLMALSTRDSSERSVLAGSKMFFGALAALTISLAVAPITAADTIVGEARNFTLAAVIAATIAIAAMILCATVFRGIDRPNRVTGAGAADLISIRDVLSMLARNHYLWIVFLAGIVSVMMLPAFSKSLLYFAKYELNDEAFGGLLLAMLTVAMVISIPLWAIAARQIAKGRVMQAAHAVIAAAMLAFFFIETDSRPLIMGIVFLAGLGIGGVNAMTLAIVPDLVEYGEWKTGRRVEAGVFAFFTFSAKLGNGIGAGLLGVMLGLIGFVANQDQTPETIDGIRTIMTFMPLTGSALIIVLFMFFRLDHHMHRRITEEIAARAR